MISAAATGLFPITMMIVVSGGDHARGPPACGGDGLLLGGHTMYIAQAAPHRLTTWCGYRNAGRPTGVAPPSGALMDSAVSLDWLIAWR
jgi:hypothetical protein